MERPIGRGEMTGDLHALLDGLRAGADETRLRLLALCATGELAVGELTHILGQSQPRVSRHLKILSDAGLLERFKEGSWVFYRLRDSALAAHLLALLPSDSPLLKGDRARLDEVKAARAEAARDYFRRNAAHWDRVRALHVDEAVVEAAMLELLGGGGIGDLLDLGTGTGRLLELLAPRATSLTGLDSSHDMLSVARSNVARAGLDHATLRQGDVYRLPFDAHSFDAVTCHQVLHFLDRPSLALSEAARVLRPGGRLLVVDFAPHGLDSLRAEHNHRRLGFAEHDVRDWCEGAGLTFDTARHLDGDPLTVTLWVAHKEQGHDQ